MQLITGMENEFPVIPDNLLDVGEDGQLVLLYRQLNVSIINGRVRRAILGYRLYQLFLEQHAITGVSKSGFFIEHRLQNSEGYYCLRIGEIAHLLVNYANSIHVLGMVELHTMNFANIPLNIWRHYLQ
jgi:hypothetical protein